MNEEEKKAIEKFVEKCNKFDESVEIKGVSVGEEYRILETVCKALDLVEKLQKENEELKNSLSWRINYCQELEKDLFENGSNYVIPKQKVKDKIEELNKKEKKELKGMKGQDRYFVKQTYQNKRMILQELIKEREEK